MKFLDNVVRDPPPARSRFLASRAAHCIIAEVVRPRMGTPYALTYDTRIAAVNVFITTSTQVTPYYVVDP